ncbi:MAG: signal recognition particle-docking protein FtsY [bacterium]
MGAGFFKKFLARFTGGPVDWDELEETLLAADFGVSMTGVVMKAMRARGGDVYGETALQVLREEILKVFPPENPLPSPVASGPHTILMTGVNGTGKTTTCAKLANWLKNRNHSCLLVAADTFRAAAIEQLCAWGAKLGLEVLRGQYQGDAAALCHDAWNSARRRNIEFLICDTAGRLHTKSNLMQELAKVVRTLGKQDASAPHEKWIVLDATTGSNAIVQAREFHKAIGLTGVVLTKLDGSGKGGVAVAIQHELDIPTRFIGTGEKETDFALFNREDFVNSLL